MTLATSSNEFAQASGFEAIVNTHRARIFRFALASLRDLDAAHSITQDCFMKAFKSWSGFRHECSVETWLLQIAVNLVRDHARNRGLQFWKRTRDTAHPPEMLDHLAGSGPNPERAALLRERVSAVWRAAGRLPERQRTVFLLRFVEDMDLLEIAAVTGVKEGTVKAHLFQALQTVRKHMGALA